jgi:hypothetical protein
VTGDERVEHLFVVRVWRERTWLQPSEWRGSAQHVASGNTLYFSRLPDLDAFIAHRLEQETNDET